jgi:hypothetical protein
MYRIPDAEVPVTGCRGTFRVGNGISFRKIPRNRLGTISVIPRKKVLIPRHSEFRGRANSEARNGTERNGFPQKMKFDGTRTASMITLTSNRAGIELATLHV